MRLSWQCAVLGIFKDCLLIILQHHIPFHSKYYLCGIYKIAFEIWTVMQVTANPVQSVTPLNVGDIQTNNTLKSNTEGQGNDRTKV